MKKLHSALAVAAALALTAAPAMAMPTADTERSMTNVNSGLQDALDTQVQPLTYSETDNRLAAATYMSDALKLLNMAETRMRAGNSPQAVPLLLGASGKLTYAYLDLYQDKSFTDRMQPLTMQVARALQMTETDPQQALAIISSLTPQLASLYQVQLASLGGGAGQGLEPLPQPNMPMNQDQDQDEAMPQVLPEPQQPMEEW